ncbi:AIR synthase related protein domain protein [Methanobacterium lacus]|uniref:AIR synthase related protein domain protein n=1 Tax=Methanobacterium lacus (strain AL-21) TaxID=877455 RepID=F0T6R0_METLA|nr:AIR synthase-related protein [Methanobacterium lacus]ADZ08293.1 AIR synthase related protein domain protein [Methanobacterium lacus]
MDIEGFVRRSIKEEDEETVQKNLVKKILEFKDLDNDKAEKMASAVIEEVKNTLTIDSYPDEFMRDLINYTQSSVSMGDIGVGSRGAGDFFVHRKIAEIVSSAKTSSYINPSAQDDGGVVKSTVDSKDVYITTAVDGIHSRLSEYPFLGGFHVARATLRDVCVMGSNPIAMLSDLHLADDGDVGKLFDFTAGVCAVSELVDVPLVAGSTLRVGGDMVLGDRLVSAVGAVGISEYAPTARKRAESGDVILLTEGSGGGTISTTAIYHGMFDVVQETMDISFIKASEAIFNAGLLPEVHAMTDVTNGGLRGDAHEISQTTGLGLSFSEEKIREMVNPKVLDMLEKLEIDPLGVSVDSLMIIAPEDLATRVKNVVSSAGVKINEIGVVDNSGISKLIKEDGREEELKPLFREAAYTKIKKIVGDIEPEDFDEMKDKVQRAAIESIKKKDKVVKAIQEK